MTIDEAIKHEEEAAEKQENLYKLCPASESEFSHCDGTKDCKAVKNGENKGCLKCAKEHRQLAEWLKELKQLREQEPILDKIRTEIKESRDIQNVPYDVDYYSYVDGVDKCLDIIDKYKAESEGV